MRLINTENFESDQEEAKKIVKGISEILSMNFDQEVFLDAMKHLHERFLCVGNNV
jgi:hypothetical protein